MIALIDAPAVIERVLHHLGLPTDIPEARPARAPPVHLLVDAPVTQGTYEQIDPPDHLVHTSAHSSWPRSTNVALTSGLRAGILGTMCSVAVVIRLCEGGQSARPGAGASCLGRIVDLTLTGWSNASYRLTDLWRLNEQN